MKNEKQSNWLKTLFIGKARDIHDNTIFHQLSLAAILAWVGLGAEGLSSSWPKRSIVGGEKLPQCGASPKTTESQKASTVSVPRSPA